MTDSKIRIQDKDVKLVRDICMLRTNGEYSVTAIFNDMKKFIKEDFRKELTKQRQADNSAGPGNGNWEDIYHPYNKFLMSATSLKSAFYGGGVSKKFALLPIIVELYIKRFKHLVNENIIKPTENKVEEYRFSPGVEAKIADLVNCFCSFHGCGAPTKAAALGSPLTPIVLGRACMIYGPVKEAPRYDPDIEIDFYGTDNGIWLCSIHADMISGSGWVDFPATDLLRWRKAHQFLVYEWVTGTKKVTTLGFHFERGGDQAALNLLNYINEQETVFMEPVPGHAVVFTTAVNNFRSYLQQEMLELKFPVFLARQASGMIQVCNAIVAIVQNPAQFPSNKDYWLVFRKVIGGSLHTIANKYKVQMPVRLRSLITNSAGTT